MSNWNDKQKEIAEKEMQHIEDENRKDGTEEIQDEKPTTETVSTDGLGYKPCAYCGAKPVVEIKKEELKGRDCDSVKMEANCPNCPQNFVLRIFEHEICKPLSENELMKDWNDAQNDFEKLKAESVEDCDEYDDSDDNEDSEEQKQDAPLTFGVKTDRDGYEKCPKCGCYPIVSLKDGTKDFALVRCPMCDNTLTVKFDETTTESMLQKAWSRMAYAVGRIMMIRDEDKGTGNSKEDKQDFGYEIGATMEIREEPNGEKKKYVILPKSPVATDLMEQQKQNEMDDTARKRDSQAKISDMCDRLKNLLLEKNRKYGDSALNPCRVFSKSDAVEQLKVRMDDKLSRIRNAQSDEDEDVYMDLAGYLVLMMVAREDKRRK